MTPVFDERFKIVIEQPCDQNYYEMIDWLHQNTRGRVEIKAHGKEAYTHVSIGFEETDDALYFKIKYGEQQ